MDSLINRVTAIGAGPTRPEPVSALSKQPASSTTELTETNRPSRQDSKPAASEEIRAAIEKIKDHIQVSRRDLQFSLDEDTGMTVVTVLDSESKEVIRQIPAEEVLAIAAHLEEARGLLFRAKV